MDIRQVGKLSKSLGKLNIVKFKQLLAILQCILYIIPQWLAQPQFHDIGSGIRVPQYAVWRLNKPLELEFIMLASVHESGRSAKASACLCSASTIASFPFSETANLQNKVYG